MIDKWMAQIVVVLTLTRHRQNQDRGQRIGYSYSGMDENPTPKRQVTYNERICIAEAEGISTTLHRSSVEGPRLLQLKVPKPVHVVLSWRLCIQYRYFTHSTFSMGETFHLKYAPSLKDKTISFELPFNKNLSNIIRQL